MSIRNIMVKCDTCMDTLQKQINALGEKVDGLHQLIEKLTGQFAEVVSECKIGVDHLYYPEADSSTHRYHRGGLSQNPAMEHKDVLADEDNIELAVQNTERQLSPEVQIQRLTAQLTAAYSRIAALEDQLIAKRIH